jgi:hypothetical protein
MTAYHFTDRVLGIGGSHFASFDLRTCIDGRSIEIASDFSRGKVNAVVEHAKLYACCGDVQSYSPSRKHYLRRSHNVLYTSKTLHSKLVVPTLASADKTDKTAPPPPREMVWPLYHGSISEGLTSNAFVTSR